MLIDATAELFRGQLGNMYEIEHLYSLKELEEYRSVRIERKKAEAEEEAKQRKKEEANRKREDAKYQRRYHKK